MQAANWVGLARITMSNVRRAQSRGFSMTELLIVLAIAGILGTLSVGYVIAARPHAELERAEMELIGNLNAARHLAISEEVQVRMQFDTEVTPPEYWAEKFDPAAADWVASGLPLYIFPTGVSLDENSFAGEIVQF